MKGSIPLLGSACVFLICVNFSRAATAPVAIPSIIAHPTGQFVVVGSSATFSVTAQGDGTLTYQWFKDGQPLGGQNGGQLFIPNVQTTNRGFYHVMVQNAAAVVSSQQAFLVPQNSAPASSGGAMRFATITAGVNAPVTNFYLGERIKGEDWVAQLYAAPVGGGELVPIGLPERFSLPGYVTGGTNFISAIAPGAQARVEMRVWSVRDGDTYEEAFANFGLNGRSSQLLVTTGPASSPARLTGLQGFWIAWLDGQRVLKLPQAQELSVGGTAVFNAEMMTCGNAICGTNLLPFAWRKNGVLIPGAASASLVLADVDVADAATYTFTTGGIRSPSYALTVLLNPRLFPIQPGPLGDVRLRIRGATGSVVGVEASSNLLEWTTLAILTNQSGVIEYLDSAFPAPARWFYRATSQ